RQLGHQPDLRRGGAAAEPPTGAAAGRYATVVRRRGPGRGLDGAIGRDRPGARRRSPSGRPRGRFGLGGLLEVPGARALDDARRVAPDLELVTVSQWAPAHRLAIPPHAVHRPVVQNPELALGRLDDDRVPP